MTGWRSTPALDRTVMVAGAGLVLAVSLGDPVLVVLVAPLVLLGALAMLHRPRSTPRVRLRLDHSVLHEGQGTRSHLVLDDVDDVEHVTRVAAIAPYVALRPRSGSRGTWLAGGAPAMEIGPRRWGVRDLGEEKVALVSAWGGYRFGPVPLVGHTLHVLPVTAPFDSRAEAPQPEGLVGRHRSRRTGEGTEFSAIRPFHSGDRLRRINWRVSLRTGDLHVVTTRAEQDAGVLLVVDALADHGRSGGIDGEASSLDVTVRAAAALAEHHVRIGDRVALRVIGHGHGSLPSGAGARHLRRVLGQLSRIRPGEPRGFTGERLQLRVEEGTVVVLLTPMLADSVATAAATLVRRGVALTVVDTLPEDVVPEVTEGTDRTTAALAWRMRSLEREALLARLAATGCPVVPWRGPGTLDEVLRRLARRARQPRVAAR